MNQPFVKNYPQLGPVQYNRQTRLKRLSIRLDRNGNIWVNIPPLVTFEIAEAFLLENKALLIKKMAQQKTQPAKTIATITKTRLYELHLIPSHEFSLKTTDHLVRMFYPSHLNPNDQEVQTRAKAVLVEIYRCEAKTQLPERLATLAKTHGFSFGRVTIRNTHSRWGSCSTENNISLSLNLMQLPDHLIDYIMLHELCHTVEKNHGPNFWKLLNSKTNGRAKELAEEVKHYSTSL